MASFGSGFASGLGQGMAMGRMIMDTYNSAKEKDDLEKAGKLDQEVVDGTLDEGQRGQIEQIRGLKNAEGKDAFIVEDLGEGKGVRFKGVDQEGGEWGQIAPSKQYKLGGLVRDKEFTKDEIGKARQEAIADVYTKNGDPMRGLQYKQASREVRSADAMEAAREEYMTGLEDFAAGKNMDKYMPMILKAYNDPRKGSKYDDGHHATYDPERNVVAFSNKDGQIVNTIPVNQQTLAAAWKERYRDKLEALDPKFGVERDKLGLEGRKLDITDRHYRAVEDLSRERNSIDRERNGLIAGGGGGANSFKAMEQKAGALTQAYMKADPSMSQADAEKRAWQVLTRDTQGLKGEPEAQMEYDDGNGNKIKGTASQVHNARMKTDPTYAAGSGTNLTMTPPAGNQTGKTAASVKPMNIEYNQSAYDNYLSFAKRGDPQAKAILAGWVQSNELSAGQRKEAERYIR